MSSDEYDSEQEVVSAKKSAKSAKKMSVERIYQRKTPLEHILLRPDTYIGSVEMETKQMWVYDADTDSMVNREVTFVPGLYKIFDEILVNAADNKQRDKNMNCIRVEIDPEQNKISIYNNGKGIPVTEHKDEKMWIPTLIFGHLLTSSNYNDEEKKVVGGRNGYGAKLCNVFSTKFRIETSCKEYKKAFSQSWTNNMHNASEAKVTTSTGEDFTRVTFSPDLEKFNMKELDKDIVALFSRRAYDVAGSTKGVKVILNGKKLPVNGFKDYCEQFIKDKEDETGSPLKMAHELVNERWEIGVTVSDKGFQQISFVNSIATTRGGKHVDYVADQIVAKMVEIIKKKNKAKVNVKPFQIKSHLWVFVNCLIENPTFDSQTKETMTLQSKSFGSKCSPNDKFFNAVNKIGVIESIMSWVKFKAESQLAKSCHSKKHAKLKGIPKLEDANDAGTKNSIDCTLILTEGDSAKSLVVSGFSVVGRDKFGVFPLRGKMLNVREATHKQILENAEINNLIKIMGLQYKKKYETQDDLKTLRYGKIMIMTDQDQDGSHIKGLLINFIHHNWPSLLKLNFLEEFITPIVKVSKGSECKSFYSLPEFEEWKKATNRWSSWKVKYYKGLGTSTSTEAKEYFSDMRRHRITFKYQGQEDDNAVMLAFSKKMIEQRKDWLTNGMEQRKRRRELGLSEIYLYEKETRNVSYKDFVNKELILFSNMDNERSIPSLMDGLKPGQRKVMYTCFKRNDKREVKVAQLAGSVGEHSAYHHGEASLMSTIINLAQNYVGSNNINLLQPIGQFGTRLQGGKDAASPRYIFTMLSPLARKIFSPQDDPLLNYLYDDNLKIEPEFYVPILPMVLVNGGEGIGTGWSTKIPNYNPREVVENIRRMLRGEEPTAMKPWFKGFRGDIVQIDSQRFLFNGEVGLLDDKSFEITELPIRVWTQTYKESVLELLLHGNEKTPAFITDYKEYHTESTVRFVVTLTDANLEKALQTGIHKTFKLQSTFSTTSMVLFDHNGVLNRYETPDDILTEFFPYRLEFYAKRKRYYEGMLHAEAQKLANQARFILEKNEGKLVIENMKKANFVRKLIDGGYDSDPVKAWKLKNGISVKEENVENDANDNDDTHETDFGIKKETESSYDYDYLFDMTMRSMLREKVDELLKKRDAKKEELEKLRQSTPELLWENDLTAFMEELDRVEEQEKLAAQQSKPIKLTIKTNAKYSKSKPNKVAEESKPSDFAERVAPKIDSEIYKKSTELAKKGQKRKRKDEENSSEKEAADSDSDIDKPLAERIGTSPQIVDEKKAKTKSVKTTSVKSVTISNQSLNNEKSKKKPATVKKADSPVKKRNSGSAKKKRNPWSESDSEDDDIDEISELSDDENDYVSVNTTPKPAKKQKLVIESEKCETSPLDKPDIIPLETTPINQNHANNDDSIITKTKADTNKKKIIYDSDEDMFSSVNKAATITSAQKRTTSEELFDAIISNNGNESHHKSELNGTSEVNSSATTIASLSVDERDDEIFEVEKPIRNKPTKASKKAFDSGSDSESKARPIKEIIKPTTKASKKAFDSDTDDDFLKSKPKKTKTAKTKKKAFNSDSSGEETPKKKKSKKKDSVTYDKFEDAFEIRHGVTTGRVRQPVKYNFGDDTTDED